MAKLHTLTDNFDDNAIDGAKWSTAAPGGGSVAETGGQMVTTAGASSGDATGFHRVVTASTWDVGSSEAVIRLVTCPSNTHVIFAVYDPVANLGMAFKAFGGNIGWATIGADPLPALSAYTVQGNAAYSATTHAWLRIRSDGVDWFLDTAASGATDPPSSGDWTNRDTRSIGAATLTGVKCVFGSFHDYNGSAGASVWDGFNIATTGGGGATFVPKDRWAALRGRSVASLVGLRSGFVVATGPATGGVSAPTSKAVRPVMMATGRAERRTAWTTSRLSRLTMLRQPVTADVPPPAPGGATPNRRRRGRRFIGATE